MEDYWPVFDKFQLFKAFQTIMVTYVFIYSLIIVVIIFFLTNSPWIEILLEQALELFLFLGIAFVFRLRDFEPRSENEDEIELTTMSSTNELVSIPSLEDSALPGTPIQRKFGIGTTKSRLIVIQNPPTIVDGKIVPSVAFATVQ